MKVLKKSISFLLFYFLILNTPTIKAQDISFSHLGAEMGLENTYITSITQDGSGCVWVGTDWGLFMLNGKRFVSYTTDNSNINGNGINVLYYEKTTDQIWIGTKIGLSIMDCKTRHIAKVIDKRIFNVFDIKPSHSKGKIWVANVNGTIIQLNANELDVTQSTLEMTFENKHVLELNTKNVQSLPYDFNCIMEDNKGNLFIGTQYSGLAVVDIARRVAKIYSHNNDSQNSIPSDKVKCLYKDSHDNIWIGTSNGLSLFNENGKFTNFHYEQHNAKSIASNDICSISEISDCKMWIACYMGGISVLDIKTLTFQDPSSINFERLKPEGNNRNSSQLPTILFKDSFGNAWIGNWGTGLYVVSHRNPIFRIIPQITNSSSSSVTAAYTSPDGNTWLACGEEVIKLHNLNIIERYDLSTWTDDGKTVILCINSLSPTQLVMGLSNGKIIIYDLTNKTSKQIFSSSINNNISSFYKEKDNTILACTNYGPYRIYNNGEIEKVVLDGTQISQSKVAAYDKQGRLWIGIYGSGVMIFDTEKDKQVYHYSKRDEIMSGAINDILADSRGGMWIATREGLTHVPDTRELSKTKRYRLADGLPGAFVKALVEDRDGNIWMTTNKGIAKYDIKRQSITNYGQEGKCFNDLTVAKTANGDIIFGSLFGALTFNPSVADIHEKLPKLRINTFTLLSKGKNGEPQDSIINLTNNEKISFTHSENSFRIDFSVNDYALDSVVEYSYKIDRLSPEWTSIGHENNITLRNVPPGTYEVHIRARIINQPWDYKGAANFSFTVKSPIYMSWWAILLYIAIIMTAIILWLRFYRRKTFLEGSLIIEKERNRNAKELSDERLRFYTNITHELRTPLTLIIGPLEDLASNPLLDSNLKPKVSVISQSATRLLALVNQIMEFRTTETQNRKLTVSLSSLSDIVRETGLRFKELNENKDLHIILDVEPNIEIYFDSDMITSILSNLLSNAMKYTNNGSITISLKHKNDEEIEMSVADTGHGISKEALPHIFDRYYQAKGKHQAAGTGIGLAIVKSLAKLHEAKLEVTSEEGKGSTFTLTLLASAMYPNAIHKAKESAEVSEQNDKEINDLALQEEKEETSEQILILIVEDNTDIRDYIAASFSNDITLFGGKKVKTLTASNGREGLEIANTDVPDIIISDIMMPEMDGIELCKNIKNNINTSHIPIVLLTAKDTIRDKEEGYDSGADSYLTKPFSARLLISRINNILQNRATMAKSLMNNIQNNPESEIISKTDETEENSSQETENIELRNPLDKRFMEKLNAIINENISNESLDIAFMTDKMAMSHSTFYRKVKSLTGYTANEYVRKLRLCRSKELLLSGEMRITEVAYACGFSSLSYFRSCFKAEYGLSPSDFLKK